MTYRDLLDERSDQVFEAEPLGEYVEETEPNAARPSPKRNAVRPVCRSPGGSHQPTSSLGYRFCVTVAIQGIGSTARISNSCTTHSSLLNSRSWCPLIASGWRTPQRNGLTAV